MYGIGRKSGHTNSNVFGGFVGRRILDPLSSMRHHGLPGGDIERATLVLDVKFPSNYHRVLLKLRCLSWLLPSCGAAHVRHTNASFLRVHAANKFVDDLWHVARRLDPCGPFNVSWQDSSP